MAQSHRHSTSGLSASLLRTFCLQILGPDSCAHLRLPGNSNHTQATALGDFPEIRMLASYDAEDTIPRPKTLAEALGEFNSVGSFETGTEKQGHLPGGPSALRGRPGTGRDYEGLLHEKEAGEKHFFQCVGNEGRRRGSRGGRGKKKRKGEGWPRPVGQMQYKK